MKKILVYMANGIGNCILAIPALKAINLLGYEVDLAIPKTWSRSKPLLELFSHQHFVTNIFQDEININIDNYLSIFVPDTYEKSELALFLMNTPNSTIVTHPNWTEQVVHESEYLMKIPRLLGYRGLAPDLEILTVPTKLPFHKPYIALAIDCLEGYPWVLKKWPDDYWVELLSTLANKFLNFEFVLIGGNRNDNAALHIVKEANSVIVHNFCGLYSVLESAYILSNSYLIVSIDNGISHLAAASGAKDIVCLYGPTLCSKNIPLGKNVHILKSDLHCSPCFGTPQFRKCTSNNCMKYINPDLVADYICNRFNTLGSAPALPGHMVPPLYPWWAG